MASRAASRQRVAAKHSQHRSHNLQNAEELIKKQSTEIKSLEHRLVKAEKAANQADGCTTPGPCDTTTPGASKREVARLGSRAAAHRARRSNLQSLSPLRKWEKDTEAAAEVGRFSSTLVPLIQAFVVL